jgi:hypothetical protein
MRTVTSLLSIVVLAACTGAAPDPSSPAVRPSAETAPLATPDQPRVDLYAPLFRRLAREATWEPPLDRLFVRDTICIPADPPFSEEDRCVDAFTTAEQESLADRLGGMAARVVFVDEGIGAVPLGRGPVVWAGPAEPRADSTWIPGGIWCGGLCGEGGTYVMVTEGDRWAVEGLARGELSWIL